MQFRPNANRLQLRPHQQDAVTAIRQGLERNPRVTVIAACGTGKTVIGVAAADHYRGHGNILVLVPSQDLITQTAWQWVMSSRYENFVGVCSLSPATRKGLQFPFTTRPKELARLLAAAPGPTVVFSTYHSLPAIVQAHRRHRMPEWTLVIADEAHHTSGSLNKSWGDIHNDARVPAQRRLYMTATPRTWVHGKKKQTELTKEPLASMNNPSIFGPVVFRLDLSQAIAQGILADYRIVVPIIQDRDLLDILVTEGATPHLDGLRLAAMQAGLLKAIAKYKLCRVLTFHSRIASARTFARSLPLSAEAVGDTTGKPLHLWVEALDSRQSPYTRARILEAFEDMPLQRGLRTRSPQYDTAIISSVRCLGEGVDVPDADAVLIADPKRSPVDIVQTLGRVLRQPPGSGKIATLIIPVYVHPKQSTEQAMASSHFQVLWNVLHGLRAADDRFWERLAKPEKPRAEDPFFADPERPDEIAQVLALREHQIQGTHWREGWKVAMRFKEAHGHLDVPTDHVDPDTGLHLGHWIGQQRARYAEGTLQPDQAFALIVLGISWDHPPESFECHYEHARQYVDAHGTLAISADTLGGDPYLGNWLEDMRNRISEGELYPERAEALNALDPYWNPAWDLDWQHDYARIRHRMDTTPWRASYQPQPTPDEYAWDHWIDQQITHLDHLHLGQRALLAHLVRAHPDAHPHALLLSHQPSGPAQAFARGLRAARQFQRLHGHLDVPDDHLETVDFSRVRLAHWLESRRTDAAQLTYQQHAAVTALGLDIAPRFLEPVTSRAA